MDEFMSLTEMGAIFGVTNQKIGRALMGIGLRTADGNPSPKALDGGYCGLRPTGRGPIPHNFVVWHAEKTLAALEQAGYKRARQEQQAAVPKAPPHRLIGPFTLGESSMNGFQVIGGDGKVSVWVYGLEASQQVLKLLNLAYDYGKLC
jgi:hypothetical protein